MIVRTRWHYQPSRDISPPSSPILCTVLAQNGRVTRDFRSTSRCGMNRALTQSRAVADSRERHGHARPCLHTKNTPCRHTVPPRADQARRLYWKPSRSSLACLEENTSFIFLLACRTRASRMPKTFQSTTLVLWKSTLKDSWVSCTATRAILVFCVRPAKKSLRTARCCGQHIRA